MSEKPEKLDLRSHTIPEDKKTELLRLFPEIKTEGGKVDFEKLKLTLGELVDVGKERYGMNWPGKSECFKTIQQPSVGTLVPAKKESINFDETDNLIIEGDNLEVLKLLQKSYMGKIKMIYIDPPYNTDGDFIYPDNYTESLETYLEYTGQVDNQGRKFSTNTESDGRFHSKWLSMLYPRLFLSRNLLSENGILVVHIDEHEQANLENLLREIFGEENLLGTVVWDKRNPKGDATGIAYQHESIFFVAKNKEVFVNETGLQRTKKNAAIILSKAKQIFQRLGKSVIPSDLAEVASKYSLPIDTFKKYERVITLEDINAEFNEWIKNQGFSGGEAAYNKIDERGDVYRLVSMAWPNKKKAPDEYFIPLKHPKSGKNCPVPERGWRNPPQTMQDLIKKGEIVFGADENVQPQRKYLLKNNLTENFSSIFPFGGSDDLLLSALQIPFDNPKPIEVAKAIIGAVTSNNDIVFDFFAGSGTTAHAVLELNAQDGNSRKFILIQLPEPTDQKKYPTIAEITKERVRRVLKKSNGNDSGQLQLGGQTSTPNKGFKVFKLQSSNFALWNNDASPSVEKLGKQLEMHVDHIVKDRTQDDILYEILLKSGYPLTSLIQTLTLAGKKVYSVQDGALFICLDKPLSLETIRAMADKKPERVVCLDESFEGNDQLKTNAVQTFKSKNITFRTV